jgi:2-polyprenyl-3-methyl-5-hydroxy-6-metoxy-1,4-benzoquinol methylase
MERIKNMARAMVFGLIGYRPQRVSSKTWDQEYRNGQWEYLGRMDSLAGLTSILGYCQYLNPGSILDVGCGEGLLAKKLKVLPYTSYVGIDLSCEAIASATARQGDARSRFAVAEAEGFQSDARFDVIVFNQSLYYLCDPAGTMAHYRTLLAPKGRIIVSMVHNARTRAAWPLVESVLSVEDAMTIIQGKGQVTTKVLLPC